MIQSIFDFHFIDWNLIQPTDCEQLSDRQIYSRITEWAHEARGITPLSFDSLIGWIRDDLNWQSDSIQESMNQLIATVIELYIDQNRRLRKILLELQPQEMVNQAVYEALDRFDSALSGTVPDETIKATVGEMFKDYSVMEDATVRALIAGQKTGKEGVDSISSYGYINYLKESDAFVQWTLFMPDVIERQQRGFSLSSFRYLTLPAVKFIGRELSQTEDKGYIQETFSILDTIGKPSDFPYDLLFMHHYGKNIDTERWHGFFGRFMLPDTPVPDGYLSWDLLPDDNKSNYLTFRSQFAFAEFVGDNTAMHQREGYDSDGMYDVTRNIILSQAVVIPYPDIYFTAEVFLNGYDKPSSGYLFSVIL